MHRESARRFRLFQSSLAYAMPISSSKMEQDPGFSIEAKVFSNRECDSLLNSLACASGQRSRAGIRHLMRNQVIYRFAYDLRLIALAGRYLGGNAVPFRATLFDKSPQTNWLIPWHQDTALPLANTFDAEGWGPWSIKAGVNYAHAPGWALERVIALRVHLDAATATNGPLKVIPNSHTDGVLSDDTLFQRVNQLGNGVVECLTPCGGVVAMRPLTIHSSSRVLTANTRRVLHIEYADSLDLGEGIRLAIC